jgi:hypothetical protein
LVNYDQVVLTNAGAAECLAVLDRPADAWNLLTAALQRFPDRKALGDASCAVLAKIPPSGWAFAFDRLPAGAFGNIAHSALCRRQDALCLALAQFDHARGGADALPWAAAAAILEGRTDAALDILKAVPQEHPGHVLAARLTAMAYGLRGDRERFEAMVAEDEPPYREALRGWAGMPLTVEERNLATAGLERLGYLFPLPAQPEALAVNGH